jgi:hypothetical protein
MLSDTDHVRVVIQITAAGGGSHDVGDADESTPNLQHPTPRRGFDRGLAVGFFG